MDIKGGEFQGVRYDAGSVGYKRVNDQYASSSYVGTRNFTPRAIFQPSSTEDIQLLIKNARDQKIPVALRTGGHQYSGASSTDDKGILLDLKHTFRRHGVDLKLKREGGKAFLTTSVSYKLGEVFDFFKENGIIMPTGQCREVHVGGHVQSGGFGMLARSFGLLVDWIREITIVNYDGEVVKVTKETEPDLFFGICGGSPGNFGVVTHYKIEVQQDKDLEGSKGLWIAFFYRDKTYKALLDLLRKKAEDPNLARGYDFTVNVTSRSADLLAVFPGSKDQLKKAVGDVSDPKKLEKLLDGKYALIVVWAQFLNIKGEAPYDPAFFNEIKSVPVDADKPLAGIRELGVKEPAPASQIYTMWFMDKAREFDLPYIKRTYTTKKLMSPNWSEWFQGRVTAIIGNDQIPSEPGLWVVTQVQIYGGTHSMFIKTGAAGNGTAIANRDSIISGTWDAFYDVDKPAPINTKNCKPQAEAWQKTNDEGLKEHFSETDRRLLWGSWGDWDLSKPDVWKCYYDEATYNKLKGIRKNADPHGTFSYSPFAVPRA
ncbi:FAD-binding protein [Microdochium nivale]|nr:FAD-binding protein [Microdochium nivale]